MFDDSHLSALWSRYRSGNEQAYEELVTAYLPLVKTTVGRMALGIPGFVSREDLYSAGCVGLLSAVKRYDPSRAAKFTTYAITRIRGAILDELRAHDTLGRVTRDRVTRIHKAERELQSSGRSLDAEAVAEEAGLTMDEYYDAELGEMAAKRISLSEVAEDGTHTLGDLLESRQNLGPGHEIEVNEVIQVVEELLTDKEKLLVVLYYRESLTLKEIGTVMDVSESRVCQLHTAMAMRVRKKLEKMGILF